MTTISDEELFIPDGFPVKGNERILTILNPIFQYLILVDKIVVCSAVNALTLNIKPINGGHDYNSNFIVAPKSFGKTTLLKNILQVSNPKNMLVAESKHFESEMFNVPKPEFIGKTWLHFDAISLFMTAKPVQRAQLIAFYTETLSDGLYSRKNGGEVIADYNLQYVMASENFYVLQKELYNSTIFDRIVPIYYHPTEEDKLAIRKKSNENRKNHRTCKMPTVKLPYISNLEDYSRKFTFEYNDEISDEIDRLSEYMSEQTQMGITRVSRYISNFICSNAYINGRVRNFVVHPNKYDLNLYEWLMPIHFPLDVKSFEFAVYSVIKSSKNKAITVVQIKDAAEISYHPTILALKGDKDYESMVLNNIRMELNKLFTRGMIEMERAGGLPIYWCKE